MKPIYFKGISYIDMRIKSCGKGLANAIDATTINYWTKELNIAKAKRKAILNWIDKRYKLSDNVIYVDFNAKKRIAA